jgi:hypothetical protein
MPYHFVLASGGNIPTGAVPHGHEADGTPLWVARSPGRGESPAVFALFNSIQPGKVRPGFGAALIPFGGSEVAASEYEVLMDAGIWLSSSGGQVPDGAIVCGREANGDPLFVARASVGGGVHPGKLRFALGAAHIGFGGTETPVTDYEVLASQEDLRRGI